jgi:hypothetical protein
MAQKKQAANSSGAVRETTPGGGCWNGLSWCFGVPRMDR